MCRLDGPYFAIFKPQKDNGAVFYRRPLRRALTPLEGLDPTLDPTPPTPTLERALMGVSYARLVGLDLSARLLAPYNPPQGQTNKEGHRGEE